MKLYMKLGSWKLFVNEEPVWEDENGNVWWKKSFSKDEAERQSRSLEGCKECIDCRDLKRCYSCVECSNCEDCDNCISCHGCAMCEFCKNCEGCRGCKDCDECKRCESCFGCEWSDRLIECGGCVKRSCENGKTYKLFHSWSGITVNGNEGEREDRFHIYYYKNRGDDEIVLLAEKADIYSNSFDDFEDQLNGYEDREMAEALKARIKEMYGMYLLWSGKDLIFTKDGIQINCWKPKKERETGTDEEVRWKYILEPIDNPN